MMKDSRPTCCTYRVPPLRPELQAAYDEMDAEGDYFATPCAARMTAKRGK